MRILVLILSWLALPLSAAAWTPNRPEPPCPIYSPDQPAFSIFFDQEQPTAGHVDEVLSDVMGMLDSSSKDCVITSVMVDGHSGMTENPRKAMDISLARAREIREKLVKAGFSRKVIIARGYGSSVPSQHYNNDAQKRDLFNRRVDVTIKAERKQKPSP